MSIRRHLAVAVVPIVTNGRGRLAWLVPMLQQTLQLLPCDEFARSAYSTPPET
ncbi:MAG TPA: hypothetical protein VHL59_04570 [Thermoanaerobaculia bacterium]|nr:hypothetical protein [Thermoanaerobaculia bacterium]